MNETKYVPCQCCSALGQVGERCEFCGNTIVAKESARCLSAKIVSRRTISGETFAEKISKYHEVGDFSSNGVALVSIGDLMGAINKNGDLIVPLDYEYIIEDGDFLMLQPSGEEEWYILGANLEFIVNEHGERLVSYGKFSPVTNEHGQIYYYPSSITQGVWDIERKKCVISIEKTITWNDSCYAVSLYVHPKGYIVQMVVDGTDFGFGFIYCDGTISFCDPEIGLFEFSTTRSSMPLRRIADEVFWVRYKGYLWKGPNSSRPHFRANVSFEEQFQQLDVLITEYEKQATTSTPSLSRRRTIAWIVTAISLVICINGFVNFYDGGTFEALMLMIGIFGFLGGFIYAMWGYKE